MSKLLFLDIETRSPLDLPKVGVWAYAEEAKIILCAYAYEDEKVKLWDCTHNPVIPLDLLENLTDVEVTCVAHNSSFERILFKKYLAIDIPIQRWVCTSVLARTNGLPASLKNACSALKFPEYLTKMDEGKALIARFCKGTIGSSPYDLWRDNHVRAWGLFGEYCKKDVEATRELYKRLSPLSSSERTLWLLDQEINDRGYRVDCDLVAKLQELIATERGRLDEDLKELTAGVVSSSRCTALLNHWLFCETGLDLPDLREETITTALGDPNISSKDRDILKNRLSASGSAVLKLNTLSKAVCSDSRLRGTLQFFGASRTGRWSGRVFQPQNLPRQTLGVEEIEKNIEDLLNDNLQINDPLRFASDCVRSCIIASPNKKLVVADLSGIEARVLAWVAGEQWKCDAFQKGEDIYKTTYATAFNIPVASVTKDQRAIGKVMELALGYQGGARVFHKMASQLELDLQAFSESIKQTASVEDWEQAENRCLWMQKTHPELAICDLSIGTACELVKTAWRAKHKGVVSLWRDCQEAFDYAPTKGLLISARRTKGVPPLLMCYKNNSITLILPSRRNIVYFDVKSDRSYLNTATSQLMRERTYGGKLTENIVQAISRDILAHGMLLATKAGYDIVLTVHDEIVCETPQTSEFSVDGLCHFMTKNPDWAKGLPLKAEGYEAKRYRK